MFKIYIEESALNEPQPMEVSPDAPVSRLVPALVEELQLPRTDLFGNRLIYFLRHADDGRVLPDHFSLRSAGIIDEDSLSLESYIADGAAVLATPSTQSGGQAPAFYANQTMIDGRAFDTQGAGLPPLPPTPPLPTRRRRGRWSRRALLLGGGIAVGVVGIGLAYAGVPPFAGIRGTNAVKPTTASRNNATMAAQKAPTVQATQAQTFVPAHATAQLAFKQHQQTVRTAVWSPDGKLLASGGDDKQLLTWNVNGQVQVKQGQNGTIRALAWSPDNLQLAAAVATQVLFLKAQDGMAAAQSVNAHNALVMALAWSAQAPHYLVSGGLDMLAIVWNTQTFQPLTTFRQHTTGILAAGWSADGQTIGSSSIGGVTRIWNGTNGQQAHGFYLEQNQAGKGVELDALAFQPQGNMLAVGGMDGILRLWNNGLTCQMMGAGATKGQCVDMPLRLNAHNKQPLRALAWSPDGRLLATGGDDNMLLIWYPAQSQAPVLKIPQNAPVLSLSWSPDGKTIAASSGRVVTLWALT
ncbi:MAG TPA: hypothetical protein VGD98_09005 [Ktedonobacteraceae bacterium]